MTTSQYSHFSLQAKSVPEKTPLLNTTKKTEDCFKVNKNSPLSPPVFDSCQHLYIDQHKSNPDSRTNFVPAKRSLHDYQSLVKTHSVVSFTSKMPRRPSSITFLAAILTSIIFFYLLFSSHSSNAITSKISDTIKAGKARAPAQLTDINDYDPIQALGKSEGPSQELQMGTPIMGPMNNETIRAELGRASWKLFHTILAKYPVKPTSQERETLSSFIYLFSRVYPCGQCANHFQAMLRKYPPQTSSREAASQWGCFVHNVVNERLGKEIFDCNEISTKYSCGCADDEKTSGEAKIDTKNDEKSEDSTDNKKSTDSESLKSKKDELSKTNPDRVKKSSVSESAASSENVAIQNEGNEVLKNLEFESSKEKSFVLEKGG